MPVGPRRGLFAAGSVIAAGVGLLCVVFATMQTQTQTSLDLASAAHHRAAQLNRRASQLNRRIIAIDNEAEVTRLEWQVRGLTVILRRISREFGIPLPPLPPLIPPESPRPTPGPLPVPTSSISPPPLPTPTPIPTPSPTCLPDPVGCLP